MSAFTNFTPLFQLPLSRITWAICLLLTLASHVVLAADERPNILFCIADDWGWPHAGAYGDPVVKTPAFDRIAREGVLFENAFVTAPSCTPCRNSILTGQYHWRLGEGVNLWSSLDPRYPVFPILLRDAGYHVGHWRKAWGPGKWDALGRTENPAGNSFRGFAQFLEKRSDGQPFCFWLGASDPHRPYKWQSGSHSGIDIERIELPADLPDVETVRHDVADYYFEVQRFDRDVGAALQLLEERGELDNTVVVMTGDHGMPFPRHKCNLYDSGTHVPLAIRWNTAQRRVTDFVSLADLAPTFLELAQVPIPEAMTGQSIVKVLDATESGQVDAARDHVLTGRERHTLAQTPPSRAGYPMRAIRTARYLYIRNFYPDRWPAGAPDVYRDCDGSPSKTFLIENRKNKEIRPFFELAFAKRPARELYDLKADPHQLTNVAADPNYTDAVTELDAQLMSQLTTTGDLRVEGDASIYESGPYYGRKK